MKRILCLLIACALILCLAGCSKSVGGTYTLNSISSDGVNMSPTVLGLNISFELAEDGVGTASYGATVLDVTWEDKGSTVIITGPNGELEFLKDGDALVYHDEGALLFFEPVEEE